jgi:plastocyanin
MRKYLMAIALTAPLGAAACGGYGGGTPTGPGTAPPADAVVIDIVRENGAQSFSPNPATIPAGRMLVWHNVDATTHHVMLDDGRIDTGNLAPGAFSAPSTLPGPGDYHCTIHPSMVGSLANGAAAD